MRRLGLPLHFCCLVVIVAVWSPASARAYVLPPCTSAEFRTIFDQIAESQLALDRSLGSVDALLEFARSQIDARDTGVPDCADAFAHKRLVAELIGDFIGRSALALGDVAAEEDPYRLLLASDQERIEDLAARVLGVDRGAAPQPSERRTPKCAADQLEALEELLSEFLALLESETDQTLRAINARLRWREVNVAQVPICTEGVELALLLSGAATESAAALAVSLVAPDGANLYDRPLAESRERLLEFQLALDERRALFPEGSTRSTALPACSLSELSQAFGSLMPDYSNLLARSQMMASAAGLQSYSEAFIDYRRENLSGLPACAEAFAAGWEVRQLLGDMVSAAARRILEPSADSSLTMSKLEDGAARAASMIDSMASRLEGEEFATDSTSLESAVACSRAELLVLQVYLAPAFHEFVGAALATETGAQAAGLSERSLEFRDLLWRELPRCAEAMELGLAMRRVAADFSAMFWLETAGLPADEILQTRAVIADISWIAARVEAIDAGGVSAYRSGKTYYISAERGANIRDCGSTDCAIVATALRGEPIRVADDSGSWYQVSLPNDQVGYIAGFLVSETRNDA